MGNFFGKEKKLIILRGLPGSGKTTMAKQLTQEHGVVFSSDDYFIENGIYTFQVSKLKDSHIWNQNRTLDAMEAGEELIVIDNTNTRKWEAKPYVVLAQKYNYTIEIIESSTPWHINIAELAKRSVQKVPEKIIRGMLEHWETDFTIDSILSSKAPWEN